MKLLAVVGTRPEAIKMAPLVLALRGEPQIELCLCVTGQHREMLGPVLTLFGLEADADLDLMESDQSLSALAAKALAALDQALGDWRPDRVLVHGDTTTAMAAALAAFHRGIPVGHIEAGLRSFDLARPFPEEMNRRAIDLVSDLLFAPTPLARRNLEAERVQGRIFVTGNTGIDALHIALSMLDTDRARRRDAEAALPPVAAGRKLLLVTGHRRESFGSGLRAICDALAQLAERGDCEIVYPLHLNPNVREPVERALAGTRHVRLLPPLQYLPLVLLMRRADLILTDSGGIQEEAQSLGTPVLVMREVTERPEAVAAGTARLVGTDARRVVSAASQLLDAEAPPQQRDRPNPYGDGKAAGRIADALLGRPFAEWDGA